MVSDNPQTKDQKSQPEKEMIGIVLDGRYKIVELIGVGGMGSIYKAEDQRLAGRPVAVKIIHPHLQLTGTFVERFKLEQQALAKVRSPHIVAIQDVGEYQHRPYFVMEYIEGQGLDALLRQKGALPLPLVVNLTNQIARALDAAHHEGIIHRDVKPSNILLSGPEDSPMVKLTDFGVARLEGAPHLTSGGVVGTALYMSPDQLDPESELDLRSDVYSLGAVLYHMLTGKPPFDYNVQWKVAQAHLAKEPQPPHHLNKKIGGAVEKVVLKALRKAKEERYNTAGEMAQALEQAASTKQSRLPWVWIPITALLSSLLLLGVYFSRPLIENSPVPSATGNVIAAGSTHDVPTQTETATPQPSPTLTPTAEATKTPTVAPSPTLDISDLIFATGIDEVGNPVDEKAVFQPQDRVVYSIFDYFGLSKGTVVRWAWLRDDQQVTTGREAWNRKESGTTYLKLGNKDEDLPTGSYKLNLFVNNQIIRTGVFTVEMPTPTPTPLPVLARMLYTVWQNQDYQIYTANTNGTDSWFAAGPGDGPSWSPDGKQFCFNGAGGMAEGVGLYTMPIGGKPQRYVPFEVHHTQWSPDGSRIVYDSTRVGFAGSKLFLCLLDKGQYACEVAGLPGEMPSWNPQGDMLVYRSCDDGVNCFLSIVDVDSGGAMLAQRRISNTGEDFSPAWSPDGKQIVFSRKLNDNNFDIYTIRVNGSGLKQLTGGLELEVTPAWTPDGRQILFRSNRGGKWAIYIMNADGTNQRRVLDTAIGSDWGIAGIDVTKLR